MGIFTGLFHSRDKPQNHVGSAFSFLFGGTTAGMTVNERTAMQTTAVYACVRILSEAIAGLPLHVYRHRADGGKERFPQHPLYALLHSEPNPEMTSFVFRETLMSHLLLWGNAYAQIIRNGRGQPVALYPLLPSKMDVSRSPNGQLLYTYYRDTDESGLKPKGGYVTLRRDEVLHIPGLGFDGLVGYSPIAMAKNAIGMALATEEYGARFFANGANPGGVLEHPGVIKDVPVAVGFRALKPDSKYRYFWLYKVKFGIPATNLQTKGESITFSTPTIEGTVLRRNKLDGLGKHPWKAEVTEGAAGVATATITGWFGQVYEPVYTLSGGE